MKINEEIIEIRQTTSDIFIEAYVGHIYLLFNEVLESLVSDSNECTLAFNYCCNIFL